MLMSLKPALFETAWYIFLLRLLHKAKTNGQDVKTCFKVSTSLLQKEQVSFLYLLSMILQEEFYVEFCIVATVQ